jgi:hypothetical protein
MPGMPRRSGTGDLLASRRRVAGGWQSTNTGATISHYACVLVARCRRPRPHRTIGLRPNRGPCNRRPGRPRQILDATLESWQKGETVEALKGASPLGLAEDPKGKRGEKLSKFEVEDEGKPSGAKRPLNITLWLAHANGEEVHEQVVYKIRTEPIVTVFRSVF